MAARLSGVFLIGGTRIRSFYYFALAFLRAAQYLFIRAETAFFCAADIFGRVRLRVGLSDLTRLDFPPLLRPASCPRC